MREILFRGKQKGIMNWVEGTGIFTDGINTWLSANEPNRPIAYGLKHKIVLSETVGQFTGLTDKNGKKIFEGDIVRVLGNQQVDDWKNVDYVALIAFLDGGFCAIDGTVEEHGFRRYALARMDFSLEIIGNQFDNPELLENP